MKTIEEYLDLVEKSFPNDDSRATLNGDCCYKTKKNGKVLYCAVGLVLKRPQRKAFVQQSLCKYSGNIWRIAEYLLSEELKEEYKSIPAEVFKACQNWHDDSRNFEKNGLSERGKRIFSLIRNGNYKTNSWG